MPRKAKPPPSSRQAKYTPDQREQLKALRHDLAILRKKGLFKGYARSADNTKANRNLVAKFRDVIEGRARVTKVKRKDQARLRGEGVTIKNGRAVTSKQYKVRDGHLFLAGKNKSRVYTLNALHWREIIRKAFKDLRPKYGLAIRVNGYSGYQIYEEPDDLIAAMEFGTGSGVSVSMLQAFNGPRIEIFDPRMEMEAYADAMREARNQRILNQVQARKRRKAELRRAGPGRLTMLRRRYSFDLDDLESDLSGGRG